MGVGSEPAAAWYDMGDARCRSPRCTLAGGTADCGVMYDGERCPARRPKATGEVDGGSPSPPVWLQRERSLP